MGKNNKVVSERWYRNNFTLDFWSLSRIAADIADLSPSGKPFISTSFCWFSLWQCPGSVRSSSPMCTRYGPSTCKATLEISLSKHHCCRSESRAAAPAVAVGRGFPWGAGARCRWVSCLHTSDSWIPPTGASGRQCYCSNMEWAMDTRRGRESRRSWRELWG